MNIRWIHATRMLVVPALLSIAACGGGGTDGGGTDSGGKSYLVSGNVSGLNGGIVVLQMNGGPDLRVQGGGATPVAFVFPTKIASSGSYAVTVKTHPTGQRCNVANGSGSATKDVTNVTVECAGVFAVGGSVSGLVGSVVLTINGGNDLSITGAGMTPAQFAFSEPLISGTAYRVSIKTPPANQSCSIDAGGTGTIGNEDVRNVVVTCGSGMHIRSADITVNPGQEVVFCYFFRFPNNEPVSVRAIRSTLPPIIQDMQVWFSTDHAPGTVLDGPCGIETFGGSPEFFYATGHVAQGGDQEVVFPADDGAGMPAAFPLAANKRAYMRLHLINSGPPELGPQTVHADLDLSLLATGVPSTPVGTFVIHNRSVNVPPVTGEAPSTAQTSAACPTAPPPGDPPYAFFNFRVLTNSRGVHTSIADGAALIFEDGGWNDTAFKSIGAPPYVTFASGQLAYACDYSNRTTMRYTVGDDPVNDEVCQVVSYYFPNKSPDLSGRFCLDKFIVF